MLRRLTGLLVFALIVTGPASDVTAQQVRGLGDDALTLPRGAVRVGAGGRWDWFNEQYDSTGVSRPSGARFTFDTLGVAQIPSLAPLQTAIQALAGGSAQKISLGKTTVSASGRVETTTLTAEYGLARWLQIGVAVPIVRTRANVFASANRNGNEANVATNPALTNSAVFNADTAFANEMIRAADSVQVFCARPGAPPVCANGAALAASAQAFGTGVAQVYGASPFVPIQQSVLQNTISTRATTLRSQLNTYAAISGSNVPMVRDSLPSTAAAPVPLTTDALQQLLADSAIGIAIDSLGTVERAHLGDVEVAGKALLFDSFHGDERARMHPQGVNERAALGVSYRLPTGQVSSPQNVVEIGTGTHEAAIGLRGYLDVLTGTQLWTSVVARYDKSLGNDVMIRVPGASAQPFVPFYRTATVHRRLGSLFELEATPRWTVNEFMSLAAQYVYRRKSQDQYTGTSFTAGPNAFTGGVAVTVDPAAAGAGTAFSEHRIGWGVTFSDLYAAVQRRTSLPIEVTYLHLQTLKGSGGGIPKLFSDQVRVRVYAGVFGR